MRFDDRVTGNLKTYAPQRARSTSTSTRPRSARTCAVDVGDRRRLRAVLERPAAAACRRAAPRGLAGARSRRAARRRAARDILHQPDDGKLLRRARDPRPLARPPAATPIVVTDVGQHQMWAAQYYSHERPRTLITSGGARHDGLRAARRDRRQDRAARRRGLGGRRRRRLPDDAVRSWRRCSRSSSTSRSR